MSKDETTRDSEYRKRTPSLSVWREARDILKASLTGTDLKMTPVSSRIIMQFCREHPDAVSVSQWYADELKREQESTDNEH